MHDIVEYIWTFDLPRLQLRSAFTPLSGSKWGNIRNLDMPFSDGSPMWKASRVIYTLRMLVQSKKMSEVGYIGV